MSPIGEIVRCVALTARSARHARVGLYDLPCGNRARVVLDGHPLCGVHYRLERLCQGCGCRAANHHYAAESCGVCGRTRCPKFSPPPPPPELLPPGVTSKKVPDDPRPGPPAQALVCPHCGQRVQ